MLVQDFSSGPAFVEVRMRHLIKRVDEGLGVDEVH